MFGGGILTTVLVVGGLEVSVVDVGLVVMVGSQSVFEILVYPSGTEVPCMHQLVRVWAALVPQYSGVWVKSHSQLHTVAGR